MGLILDSSVVIAAERQGYNAHQTMAEISKRAPGEDLALSTVTLTELAHGAARANTQLRKAVRLQLIDELIQNFSIYPVTIAIALRAGEIDGENTAKGIRIALSDLYIGVTALDLGYSIATANLRHFQMIPGLGIVPF